tara:strand:- start:1247 stop:1903 length:657 start_codon:yes stop_codon:yes gene_type:complete
MLTFLALLICIIIAIAIWKIKDKKLIFAGQVENYLKRDVPKSVTIESLKDVVDILNKSDIRWAVSFGTLLGLFRDQDPIEGDDDIDILISAEDKKKLINLFRVKGFRVLMNHEYFVQVEKKSHVIVDFYQYKKNIKIITKNHVTLDFYLFKNYKHQLYDICVPWEKFPIKFYPIKTLKWNQQLVNIPNGANRLLEDYYENWKIPDKGRGHRKNKPKCK